MIKFLLKNKDTQKDAQKEEPMEKLSMMARDFVARNNGKWTYDDYLVFLNDMNSEGLVADRTKLLEMLEKHKIEYASEKMDLVKPIAQVKLEKQVEEQEKAAPKQPGLEALEEQRMKVVKSIEDNEKIVNEQKKELKKFEESMSKKMEEVKLREWGLEKRDALLERKKYELLSLQEQLVRKEISLKEREALLEIESSRSKAMIKYASESHKKLDAKASDFKKEVAYLESKKQEIESMIKAAEMKLAVIKSEQELLNSRNLDLMKAAQDPESIAKKEIELSDKEKMLIAREQELASSKLEIEMLMKEKKTTAADRDIKHIIDSLNSRERELARRESELKEREKQVMRKLHDVSKKQMHHFVHSNLKKGVSESEIKSKLLTAGWHEKHVDEAITAKNADASYYKYKGDNDGR